MNKEKMIRRPELLLPAGDPEKLKTAIRFGADAVYLGYENFGLRAHAGNFSLEALWTAREVTRQAGVAIYLTLNASLLPTEFQALESLLEDLKPLDLDAYIVADPGVLATIRRVDQNRAIHLSTQANTCNPQAAEFWRMNGVTRINLARELTLEDISAFTGQTDIALECFVHGAMCIAHSGRCLISAALNGRSANRGDCSQPCRWNYQLTEQTRPDAPMDIEEDFYGTYFFNSRDLCLVEHLPKLIHAGVSSFKVEGRMKSLYYVATVARVYRDAIDRLMQDPDDIDPRWRAELETISHRPYDTGFLFGRGDAKVHSEDARYLTSHDFVGLVRRDADGLWVEGRNRFLLGDEIELIGPQMRQEVFKAVDIRSVDGKALPAGQPNAQLRMPLPGWAGEGDLLRLKRSDKM